MRLSTSPSTAHLPGARRTRRWLAAAAALTLAVGLSATAPSAGAKENVTTPADTATQFRIASFNILGAGHTDNGSGRKGFEKSAVRMGYTVQLLQQYNLSVAGLQEFQAPQYQELLRRTGDTYGIYPGATFGASSAPMHNSIIWRKSEWQLVEARTQSIPYGFKNVNGQRVVSRIQMPVIKLQRLTTGQQVWVSNFHNAADYLGGFTAKDRKQGIPQQHRNEARALQIKLIKSLRAAEPSIPVFMTGDMNETSNYFCDVAKSASVQAAGPGGITSAGKCAPPKPIGVDWVFGTKDVSFSGHQRLRTALVAKATDHPLVISDVNVAPIRLQSTPIRRVVAISVEGLRPGMIKKMGAKMPHLNRMVAGGASTMRAHTATESTATLANQASIVTGRRVSASSGGHGVRAEKLKSTVHGAAGRYTSSIFDIARNNGRSTAAYTDSAAGYRLLASWGAKSGGSDPQGLDAGRNKFNVRTYSAKPDKLIKAARAKLSGSPAQLTYLQLTGPDTAGHKYGFTSKRYRTALIDADRRVGRIISLVSSRSALRGSTLVVLTSSNGGSGRSHSNAKSRANHTVPFIVWGPSLGIPAGSDLFALNPQLTASADQLGWSTPTIRNASLANVVTSALRLPSVPGSSTGWKQDLSWTVRPVPSAGS
ncbi:alkaline phosphatase family protein [Nocardioides dubius]|uniref:Endonuclease/exonuclease/phosphatase domain-containing protein n=1 Tax=Nocardioides dubius TaxID=317019 RepID=A0ABN1TS74_9ACTN